MIAWCRMGVHALAVLLMYSHFIQVYLLPATGTNSYTHFGAQLIQNKLFPCLSGLVFQRLNITVKLFFYTCLLKMQTSPQLPVWTQRLCPLYFRGLWAFRQPAMQFTFNSFMLHKPVVGRKPCISILCNREKYMICWPWHSPGRVLINLKESRSLPKGNYCIR